MAKVTCDMAVSVDGFVAGPNQSLDKPFGDGVGDRLHRWMFEQPEANAAAIEAIDAPRAYVMGRNMFGPGRGAWDEQWKGWWGDDPPYHAPVFVLTHHPREPLTMLGGTTFTFVTDGIESALAQAREAAGDGDVAIAGGGATVNQYLAEGLIERVDVSATDLVTHMTYRVIR
jgi:dihydrofolate reductase